MNDAFVKYSIMELLRGIHDRDVQISCSSSCVSSGWISHLSTYCYYPFSLSFLVIFDWKDIFFYCFFFYKQSRKYPIYSFSLAGVFGIGNHRHCIFLFPLILWGVESGLVGFWNRGSRFQRHHCIFLFLVVECL